MVKYDCIYKLHNILSLLLYHPQVPKVQQLLRECTELPGSEDVLLGSGPDTDTDAETSVARFSTSATDRVSHSVLTVLAAPHHHSKEHSQK